jgi:rhamnosyltransferase
VSDSRLPDVDSTRRANGAEIAVAHPAQVAAIVVLFHPDWDFVLPNLARLAGQVGSIVLVDNTPDPLPPIEPLRDNVVLITLAENTGIAHAQNVGAAEAERRGAEYLVFFDQDSEIDESLIARLLEALATLTALGEAVAAVGPRPFDTTKGEKHLPPMVDIEPVGDRFTRVWHLISSGSLISLETFHAVGPMDASLFIDSVDHEWCWRARQRGYSCFIDESVLMYHALGSAVVRILGYPIRNTEPTRLYYQFRNQVRLIFYYHQAVVPWSWRIKRLLILPPKIFVYLSFGPMRWRKLTAMYTGIRDGLFNRGGGMGSATAHRSRRI